MFKCARDSAVASTRVSAPPTRGLDSCPCLQAWELPPPTESETGSLIATIDGQLNTKEFKGYTQVPDRYLPFDVIAEHLTHVQQPDGSWVQQCCPKRKWAYFYDDSIFSSGACLCRHRCPHDQPR